MIFIVEDELDVASLIVHTLESAGLATAVFPDGQHVIEAALEQLPELILLDVMLPGLNGMEILRGLAAQQRASGIRKIMLSACGSEQNKVRALELGADDYVTKPFSPRELVLRIRAVLRRPPAVPEKHQTIHVGGIVADLDARTVAVDGRESFLSSTEFNLLVYFMAHAGRILSRDRLLADLWPSHNLTDNDRIIDVYVCRLRERIEADPSNPCRLVTKRGEGYKLLAVG